MKKIVQRVQDEITMTNESEKECVTELLPSALRHRFRLIFDNSSLLSIRTISMSLDEVKGSFAIRFHVPVKYRDNFSKDILGIRKFRLEEMNEDGGIIFITVFDNVQLTSNTRTYDYAYWDPVIQEIRGTYTSTG